MSDRGSDSIYVYKDPIKAVGVVRGADTSITALESYLSPGRTVVAKVGDTIALMNDDGRLALVEITGVGGDGYALYRAVRRVHVAGGRWVVRCCLVPRC